MRGAAVLSRMLSLGVLALLPSYVGCASGNQHQDAGSMDSGGSPWELTLRFSEESALQLVPLIVERR